MDDRARRIAYHLGGCDIHESDFRSGDAEIIEGLANLRDEAADFRAALLNAGFGATSGKALPGEFDTFSEALDACLSADSK